MQFGYGPAFLLGAMIGGAILLDDVITPPGPPHRVAMFHHGDSEVAFKGRPGETQRWVMRSGAPEDTEIHKEVRIHVQTDEDENVAESEQMMISVMIDAEGAPGNDLAAAIREIVDAARAEGREPSEAEIEAAVRALAGDVNRIDIEVDTTAVTEDE